MITAGDFRNGVTFEMDGQVCQVVEFQHVKPGKGAAFVRTKIKNAITGAVTERTFSPTDKFENAYVERREMQYLYADGELYYFMDMESFEQIPIDSHVLGDSLKFVKEEMMVKILSYKGNVFCHRAADVCRAGNHGDRAGRPRRHRHEHHEARHAGDRRRDQGPALHQRWRQN